LPKVTAAYLDARRREILSAASTLFAERGFAQTSMADVCAATGLSTGAVYRYFASKNDLVLAVCKSAHAQLSEDDSAGTALAELITSLFPGPDGLAHARLVTQIWGEAAVDPSLAAVVRARQTELRDAFARRIAGPAARQTAEVVLATLTGYAALVAIEAPVDHDTFHRTIMSLLDPVTVSSTVGS
jgi:TetR/AcrR family transcriptional regulator, transcriptional repressor of aconitase